MSAFSGRVLVGAIAVAFLPLVLLAVWARRHPPGPVSPAPPVRDEVLHDLAVGIDDDRLVIANRSGSVVRTIEIGVTELAEYRVGTAYACAPIAEIAAGKSVTIPLADCATRDGHRFDVRALKPQAVFIFASLPGESWRRSNLYRFR